MTGANLNVERVVSQMFGQNAFILHLDGRQEGLVIDPGFDAQEIVQRLQDKGLTPAAVLNTHGHMDHIVGNAVLKEAWPECPLVIGEKEAQKLTDSSKNLSRDFGFPMTSPPADQLLADGEVFEAAGISLEVVDAPGHSAGHVVYVWKQTAPWIVFCGDVLFQGSIGRSDFPDSNHQQLIHSITTRLYTLPDDAVVMPGHGDSTTIGQEKRTNPFVRG